MPKAIIQKVLKLPHEYEPIPADEWTDEERAREWEDPQGRKRIGLCTRQGPQAYFNYAERLYEIASWTPEGDKVSAKEAASRVGNLLVYLNPELDKSFDIPSETPLFMTDVEYREVIRLLEKYPFPKHPAWAQFVAALVGASSATLDEVAQARGGVESTPSVNGHAPASEQRRRR